MRLYDYFRSSAAYRVRIVLNLKGLKAERIYIHLAKGEQHGEAYKAVNPQGLLPVLVDDDGTTVSQSLAIIEYLDDIHPNPRLLPADTPGRARVRSLAYQIACEIHPLNNLRVLKYLTGEMGLSEEQKLTWYRHWIATGFEALEKSLAASPETGDFCHGNQPGLADVCLVPQVFNARRFECDLSAYPTITRIADHCNTIDAFAAAAPARQPDAG